MISLQVVLAPCWPTLSADKFQGKFLQVIKRFPRNKKKRKVKVLAHSWEYRIRGYIKGATCFKVLW